DHLRRAHHPADEAQELEPVLLRGLLDPGEHPALVLVLEPVDEHADDGWFVGAVHQLVVRALGAPFRYARAEIPKRRGPHPGEGNPRVCSRLGALEGLIFRDERLAPQTVCRSGVVLAKATPPPTL